MEPPGDSCSRNRRAGTGCPRGTGCLCRRRQMARPPSLLRCLVADDPVGQHDVARPAAGPAEACEHPVAACPVLGGQPLPAVSQRPRRRARRTVPGRIPPAPPGISRKPPPPNVTTSRNPITSRDHRHPAAAFRFSFMPGVLSVMVAWVMTCYLSARNAGAGNRLKTSCLVQTEGGRLACRGCGPAPTLARRRRRAAAGRLATPRSLTRSHRCSPATGR